MVNRKTSGLRKDRTAAIGYLLIFFLFAAALSIAPVSAKILTYDANSGAGSVQDLINASASGDSVLLGPGKYSGNIIIDRAIVFGALERDAPPEIVSEGLAGITVAADGVVVDGVIITGDARNGIIIQSKNDRIENVTITGLTQGIAMRSAVNCESDAQHPHQQHRRHRRGPGLVFQHVFLKLF